MSVEAWKLEKDLCRCCHAEGAFKSLYTQHFWLNNEEVVYCDMLRECYGIELAAMTESISHTLCTICNACIQRLRDATEFKCQVRQCEKIFREQYLRLGHKVPALQVEIKQEAPDLEDDVKVNVYCDKGWKERDTDTVADDRSLTDDDFRSTGHGDDGDYKLDEEEDIPPVRRKTKYKKTKIASSKVKRKKKVVRSKKKVATPKDEEIVGTIQGVINVVKRPPLFRLQEDIDYKRIGDSFKCCRCEKENKSLTNLRLHIKNVHLKIPKYTCKHCSKIFLTPAPFIKHKFEEHNIDDRFKCNACDNIFNTRVQLRRHINSFHMLGEKYKCTLCDYECFSVESLYKHKFKHKTVKDYHCVYCRKSFLRKTTLQLHERIHTGDRRKVCKVCGQAFVQKASLNYHMTKYHPEVAF